MVDRGERADMSWNRVVAGVTWLKGVIGVTGVTGVTGLFIRLLVEVGWMGYKSWKWDHWLTDSLTGLTCRDASASKKYIYFKRPECVPGNMAFFRVFSFCFLSSPIWLFFQLYLQHSDMVYCVNIFQCIQCSVVQIAPPCLCFVISSRCAMCRCPFG